MIFAVFQFRTRQEYFIWSALGILLGNWILKAEKTEQRNVYVREKFDHSWVIGFVADRRKTSRKVFPVTGSDSREKKLFHRRENLGCKAIAGRTCTYTKMF